MKKRVIEALPALSPLELNRRARWPECERLSGVSRATLERLFPEHVVKIGKSKGMRVGVVLQIGADDELD